MSGNRRGLVSEVAISVASGLVLAGSLAVIGKAFKLRIFSLPIPLGAFIFTVVVLLIILAFTRSAGRKRGKRVFLLVPAFVQKHWFAELVHDLTTLANIRGYDLVIKMPTRDFSGQNQARQFRDIALRESDFSGGFIIPAEPHVSGRELLRSCEAITMPIIFLDVPPAATLSDLPRNAMFVGYRADEIGKSGAAMVIRHLRRANISSPLIIVIGSNVQTGRQIAFRKALMEKFPNAEMLMSELGLFARDRARRITQQFISEVSSTGQSIDVVWCANDEMALGAVDAIVGSDSPAIAKTSVFGVDGTAEARSLIDSGRSPFKGTLIQDAGKVAEIAMDLFEKRRADENTPTETYLSVEAYPIELIRG